MILDSAVGFHMLFIDPLKRIDVKIFFYSGFIHAVVGIGYQPASSDNFIVKQIQLEGSPPFTCCSRPDHCWCLMLEANWKIYRESTEIEVSQQLDISSRALDPYNRFYNFCFTRPLISSLNPHRSHSNPTKITTPWHRKLWNGLNANMKAEMKCCLRSNHDFILMRSCHAQGLFMLNLVYILSGKHTYPRVNVGSASSFISTP